MLQVTVSPVVCSYTLYSWVKYDMILYSKYITIYYLLFIITISCFFKLFDARML